ncbi:hypothetical protein [Pseudaminobacter soli (ex Li et al. 2025)]|uniref:DUF2946 domain-containing protein n=1 Tax=Pseudaminobacter soli (ex Li et al. 2025) TaxID=1295366 RepID=A0A2P7RPT3_9HYPH|nr:hypothetical protein [Mesorhizobium soli]PSJ52219.1 hypothetical protein C7I85_28970 [Mesorhizobium soli]
MRWLARHFFALLLAVSVTGGLSLSPVLASDMAIKMAAADMGMPSADGCTGCHDQGMDSGKMTTCLQVCAAPVMALLPHGLASVIALPASSVMPLPASVLPGRDTVPDPHPPRPFGLI